MKSEYIVQDADLIESRESTDFFTDKKARIADTVTSDLSAKDWRNGVLVLIPTRLGMKSVDKNYYGALVEFFSCPLNVGIIGGKPKEAYYLVGLQDSHLIYLDPHTTLDAVPNTEVEIAQKHSDCHQKVAKKIHFTKLDPCLSFGFYL